MKTVTPDGDGTCVNSRANTCHTSPVSHRGPAVVQDKQRALARRRVDAVTQESCCPGRPRGAPHPLRTRLREPRAQAVPSELWPRAAHLVGPAPARLPHACAAHTDPTRSGPLAACIKQINASFPTAFVQASVSRIGNSRNISDSFAIKSVTVICDQ